MSSPGSIPPPGVTHVFGKVRMCAGRRVSNTAPSEATISTITATLRCGILAGGFGVASRRGHLPALIEDVSRIVNPRQHNQGVGREKGVCGGTAIDRDGVRGYRSTKQPLHTRGCTQNPRVTVA